MKHCCRVRKCQCRTLFEMALQTTAFTPARKQYCMAFQGGKKPPPITNFGAYSEQFYLRYKQPRLSTVLFAKGTHTELSSKTKKYSPHFVLFPKANPFPKNKRKITSHPRTALLGCPNFHRTSTNNPKE